MNKKEKIREIKVAILGDEPLGWGSGKHYFQLILDNYSWKKADLTYKILADYIFDKEIIRGKLSVENYDVLLAPGGGVGDGECIIRGLNFLPSTLRWKKKIREFIKSGGGYVGICGGTALLTSLSTGPTKKPTSMYERLYEKSAPGVTAVKSYYKDLGLPLLNLFQYNHPEKIGASGYVFSFAPGETKDGKKIHSGGVPIDFQVLIDNPIFSDYKSDTIRIRWWGGPALIPPKKSDRNVNVLVKYPKVDLSEDKKTMIYGWSYRGGFFGIIKAMIKALKLIKKENDSLKNLVEYTYYMAGDWKKSKNLIKPGFSSMAGMTTEIYPNKNKGRIALCASHPEYMIWWDGHIEEIDDSDFNCLATGFHKWKDIKPLSKTLQDEFTYTWWIVRRLTAWAAKVSDNELPPIEKGKITKEAKEIISEYVYWDGTLKNQMKNI